ncbi:MAG: rhomboid family intramembrane serine protease [Thermomicrobiales bacterium]
MLPIGDYAGQRRSFPIVNYGLIAANVLVFLYQLTLPARQLDIFVASWGAVPFEITHGVDRAPTIGLPIYVTLLTAMFIHGGWAHLLFNMLYLWIFGDNVENAFGSVKYLVFYLVCGIAASLAQIAISADSLVPTIGASGAIAGVMGAYLVMFPRATIRTLVFLGFFVTIVYLPAVLVIGIWFVLQLISGVGALGARAQDSGGVAFWAHIGGLVTGAILALLLRRRDYQAAAPSLSRRFR